MNQKGQPNSNQLKQLKSQSESAASACVRGVALQSVKNMHLLRCWAGEASTRGCATVCAQLRCVAHNLVTAHAAVCERHRQHPNRWSCAGLGLAGWWHTFSSGAEQEHARACSWRDVSSSSVRGVDPIANWSSEEDVLAGV